MNTIVNINFPCKTVIRSLYHVYIFTILCAACKINIRTILYWIISTLTPKLAKNRQMIMIKPLIETKNQY